MGNKKDRGQSSESGHRDEVSKPKSSHYSGLIFAGWVWVDALFLSIEIVVGNTIFDLRDKSAAGTLRLAMYE